MEEKVHSHAKVRHDVGMAQIGPTWHIVQTISNWIQDFESVNKTATHLKEQIRRCRLKQPVGTMGSQILVSRLARPLAANAINSNRLSQKF